MWKKANAVNTIKDRTREEMEKKKESQEKKTLILGGTGGMRRRGRQKMRWLDGIVQYKFGVLEPNN